MADSPPAASANPATGANPGAGADPVAPAGALPVRPGFWHRPAGRVCGLGLSLLLVVLVGLWGYFYFDGALGNNIHQVDPDPQALYRTAQLSGPTLAAVVKEDHIRTVLNLRGANPGKSWYDTESHTLAALGVKEIDIHMSGKHMPTREALVTLVTALESAERPIMVHCAWGSDRTGLACALDRLIKHPGDYTAARAELAFFPYGHTGHFGYEAMDHVVDQFERYQAGGGKLDLAAWAAQVYQPEANAN
ncbi:MAG: tyrosine-protein phosphatase [Planctomycetota bacterium]